MFATRLDALNKMKRGLTKIVWLVSKLGAERAQVQSVVQGLPCAGNQDKVRQTLSGILDIVPRPCTRRRNE